MGQVRGKQVGLRKGERQVTRPNERFVDTTLAHGLALARAELALPAPPEAGYPIAVFEVQRAHIRGVSAIQFLRYLHADVVVHVIVHAILGR